MTKHGLRKQWIENKTPVIAIDFDGVINNNDTPLKPIELRKNIYEIIRNWREYYNAIITIWTCRNPNDTSGNESQYFHNMIEQLELHGIEYDYINESPDGLPFTPTPKIYFDFNIDDKNIGFKYYGYEDIIKRINGLLSQWHRYNEKGY